jgi:hypothetical protein
MPTYSEIVEAVNKILGEYDFPLTIRQIYYRLVAANLIPNKRSAYNQLSSWLVKARENGEVDDTRIEDRARQVLEAPNTFSSPEQFVEAAKHWFKRLGNSYLRDLWEDQDFSLEVWVEKDALSRVISNVIEPYRVTLCPSRGYSSYTYIKRMAIDERLSEVDKPVIILDFRDHDPSGIQMTEDLQTRFNRYGEDLAILVKRIALTIDQVRQYNLIPNPTKRADTRSPSYVTQFGDQCWELDAIEPSELQRIVRESVEDRCLAMCQILETKERGKPRSSPLLLSFPAGSGQLH